MSNLQIEALKKRRSQYALSKELPVSQQEVTALIQEAIRLAPSSFNSQSSRAVILFNDKHERFWELVRGELRKVVPADQADTAAHSVDRFAAGAGTVLFFEDQNVIAELQKAYALYAAGFPDWSEHSTAMAQLAVWSTLASANVGASLQHYNPLVDTVVAAEWDLPTNWKLRAQMPFGGNAGGFNEKTFIDNATRFRVLD